MWKNGNKKDYNEKCIFLTIRNRKSVITHKCARLVLSLTSVYFAFSKVTLSFSYSFHVPCTILFKVYFYTVRSMFPFLFNQSQSEVGVVNQKGKLCFRRRSTIGQLNLQSATTKKEKLYTLSKITHIKFWRCSSSVWDLGRCSKSVDKLIVKYPEWISFFDKTAG